MGRTRTGDFRTLVSIQTPTRSVDLDGEPTLSWGVAGTAWASIAAMSGGEEIEAKRTQGRLAYLITLRNFPTLTRVMRIVAGTRIFNVDAVWDPEERGRYTEARCLIDADATAASPLPSDEVLATGSFDALTLGETTVFEANGTAAVPLMLVFRTTTLVGATDDPVVSAGTNGGNDNVLAATKLYGLRTSGIVKLVLDGAAAAMGVSDELKVEVTVAGVATTYTVAVDVVGYQL